MTISRKSKESGSSLPITMMFFMVIGMVTITAVGVTTTSDRMAERFSQKSSANLLAESAVNELYDQAIRNLASGKSPGNLSLRPMNTSFDGKTRSVGNYSATIIDLKSTVTTPAPGYSATSILTDYQIHIRGTGVAPNGTTSEVEATFTASTVTSGTPGSTGGSSVAIYPGAIQSNTTVDLITNDGIKTVDNSSMDKEAHVLANKGISWTPFSNQKDNYWREDLIDIQGHAMVPDQPSPQPLDFTKGIGGLGNPNGSKNYKTAVAHTSIPSSFTVMQNEVTPIGQPKTFMNPLQWKTQFDSAKSRINSSPAKTIYTGSLNSTTVPQRTGDNWRVIKAPAFINGNLTVNNGTTLRFEPSIDPNENIIYVNGNISNLGALYNLGVTIMFTGQYTDASNAEYRVDEQGSTWPNQATTYQNAALISSSFMKNAISITSTTSSRIGLVYAANGGIDIGSHLETNGVLVSSGLSRDEILASPQYSALVNSKLLTDAASVGGGIKIKPNNGSTFTLNYVRECMEYGMPGSTNSGVTLLAPLAASRLENWNKLK